MRWVLTQVVERLQREGDPRWVPRLLMATFVLSGLRLDRNQVRTIFSGVRVMRESDTYQGILDEGGVVTAQRLLLQLGRKKFGEPNETIKNNLRAIQDLEHLYRLGERVLDVATWQELLETP